MLISSHNSTLRARLKQTASFHPPLSTYSLVHREIAALLVEKSFSTGWVLCETRYKWPSLAALPRRSRTCNKHPVEKLTVSFDFTKYQVFFLSLSSGRLMFLSPSCRYTSTKAVVLSLMRSLWPLQSVLHFPSIGDHQHRRSIWAVLSSLVGAGFVISGFFLPAYSYSLRGQNIPFPTDLDDLRAHYFSVLLIPLITTLTPLITLWRLRSPRVQWLAISVGAILLYEALLTLVSGLSLFTQQQSLVQLRPAFGFSLPFGPDPSGMRSMGGCQDKTGLRVLTAQIR